MQPHQIRELRRTMGWTRVELARRASLTSERIKALEESNQSPTEPEIESLQRAFGFQATPEKHPNTSTQSPFKKSDVALLLEHLSEGQRLKIFRERKDFTRKELAREMGVPWTQISEWENSTKPLPPVVLNTLAQALGCEVSELSSQPKKQDPKRNNSQKLPHPLQAASSQPPVHDIPMNDVKNTSLEDAVTGLSASEQSALLTLLGAGDKERDPQKTELNALFDRMSITQRQGLLDHLKAMLG